MDHRRRLIVGCMSGTSLDAVDAAAVVVHGGGLELRAEVRGFASRPLGGLGDRLRALASGEPVAAGDVARLALEIGEAHAAVVAELVGGGERPELVAAHGQTVFHEPPASLQLINPWPIARRLGCAVVTDLRGADLATGGQGAPITPLADWALFRSDDEDRLVVNLGGFCNATLIPRGGDPGSVRGADVCACNHVLDGAARAGLGVAFDEGGLVAAGGRGEPESMEALQRVLEPQGEAGRSLGTGDEASAWVDAWAGRLPGEALVAGAADAVGRTIGRWIAHRAPGAVAYLAGGGTRNRALVDSIGRSFGGRVRSVTTLGVEPGEREAAGMAVLGALAADGVDITTPGVTGRTDPVPSAGSWVNLRASE